MNQVFSLTNDKSWKTVLVQENRLLLINKSYSTSEEFLKGYEDSGISNLLKKKKEIDLFQITALKHRENHSNDLNVVTADKSESLIFSNAADMNAVISYISGIKKLTPATEKMTAFSAIKGPGIGLLVTLVFGWIIYEDAATIESGGEVSVSGRRSGMKQLFAWIAESIGTQGALIATGVIAAVFLFFMYKRFSNPPNEVVYA